MEIIAGFYRKPFWDILQPHWQRWKTPLAVGLATLGLKFIVGLFLLNIPSTPVGLDEWSVWTRFTDIEWELQIANVGYGGGNSWVAKHPVYPGLLRTAMFGFGLSEGAAVAVIQFTSVVLFAAGLRAYVKRTIGGEYADNAAWLGIFSPLMGGYAAFFGMPDVLGGAFMWWALVAFHEEKMPRAGFWSVLAVAARPQGIVLPLVLGFAGGVTLLVRAWNQRSLRGLANWHRLLWLVPAVMWYLWYLDMTSHFTQVPMAPLTAQSGSFRGVFFNPLERIGFTLEMWFLNPRGLPGLEAITVYSFGWFACTVLTVWGVLRRRLPVEILIAGLAMTLVPASTALYALGRYIQFSPLALGLIYLVPRNAGNRTTAVLGLGIALTTLALFLLIVVNPEVGYSFLP